MSLLVQCKSQCANTHTLFFAKFPFRDYVYVPQNKYIASTLHPDHFKVKGISETDAVQVGGNGSPIARKCYFHSSLHVAAIKSVCCLQDIASTSRNCSFHKLVVLDTREGGCQPADIADAFRIGRGRHRLDSRLV